MIEGYKFGSIKINGKEYNHDAQVFPTGEVRPWWRKASHEVEIEDIKEALEQEPKIIVFGTGNPGLMRVFDDVKERLKSSGIELIIRPTKKAIEKFNELKSEEKKVVGLFHLTC